MASPESLQPYRKVQTDAEKELTRVLESTARAIRARISKLPVGIGGQVRGAQLRTTLAAIAKMQRSMWVGGVAPIVVGGVDDAEKAAESAIEAMTRVAYTALPDAAAEVLIRGLRLAAESGLKSDRARRKRELSAHVYRQAALQAGKVETLIREGLIGNLSAKELASTVYEHVSPTVKGGASYAAMRLARTEINNAFHERQLQGATRPGVKAAKWNLSGSHRVPDKCNVYAAHGGNGEWAPDKIPEKPHPQCFCYLTYVTSPPEEFQKRLAAGSFDDEIERRTRENMARLGQKVGKLEPRQVILAKKAAPASRPIKPTFAAQVKAGVASETTLSGGSVARTDLVTLKGGKKAVRKTVTNEYRVAKDQQDAEELMSDFARRLGITAPEVYRSSENTVYMDFMQGTVAISKWDEDDKATRAIQRGSDKLKKAAIRIGLMDIAFINTDRNLGNWLVDGEDIVAIDHGMASDPWPDDIDPDGLQSLDAVIGINPFTPLFKGRPKAGELLGESDQYSQSDLNFMNNQLVSMLPKFKRLGKEEWYHRAIERIEFLRPYAKGKEGVFQS